jgi:hypothetical protein
VSQSREEAYGIQRVCPAWRLSHAFQDELKTLGIESSTSVVRQPEGNDCVERFIRTLKEQLL